MTPEDRIIFNKSVLSTAREQLEQNRRLIEMLEDQDRKLQLIEKIADDPHDYSGTAICMKIMDVLNGTAKNL